MGTSVLHLIGFRMQMYAVSFISGSDGRACHMALYERTAKLMRFMVRGEVEVVLERNFVIST